MPQKRHKRRLRRLNKSSCNFTRLGSIGVSTSSRKYMKSKKRNRNWGGTIRTGHPVHVDRAYIPYVHTFNTYIHRGQAVPACAVHMHGPQNKASSLGGALQRLHSLLSPVHPAAGLVRRLRARRWLASSPVSRHTTNGRTNEPTNSYSNTLWLCSWLRYHGCRGKGNCLWSLSPGNVREIPLVNRGIAYRAVRSIV